MDPDALLAQLLAQAAELLEDTDDDLAADMAAGLQYLDGWLAGGGFLPRRWQR